MIQIQPKDVLSSLNKHMLADGFPFVFDLDASRGAYFYDLCDKQGGKYDSKDAYLDFFSFFATLPVGFNHPKMTRPEVVQNLGRIGIHNITNSDLYTVEMAEFVETFWKVTMPRPDYMKYVFWVAGGALGIENALKAAMDWKVRKNFAKGYPREIGHKVLHFEEAFHGRSGYTVSLTNTADPRKYKYFTKFDWPRVVNPKMHFPFDAQAQEQTLKLERLAEEQMKAAFRNHKDDICAVIIEPIQAEGGDHHFRPEFMQTLRRLCDENDAMLIFDEVQSGLGLTGKMWAHEHSGVRPDMFAFGKKMQVCGFVANERLDEVSDHVFKEESRINSTWGGNLVDMYRCKLYLEIIQEDKLLENATKLGTVLLKGLQELQGEFPQLMFNARGQGLMCAFDLASPEQRDRLLKNARAERIVALGCGAKSVRFRPTLDITEDALRDGLGRFRRAFAAMK